MENKSPGILIKPFLQLFIIAGILIFTFPRLVNAQTHNIRFKHMNVNDGLSNGWIHSIIQDKHGFIWIGTDDGLNRYDGYAFHIYKNNLRNKNTISNNGIRTIFEDSKGDLWIGTRRGLNLYNRKNEQFVRYPRWLELIIQSVAEDKDKILWIGTDVGLYSYDLKNDSIKVYSPGNALRNNVSRLIRGSMTKIFIDSKNNIWIGSSEGLHLYDREENSFINYYHDEKNPKSISSDDVHAILA